MEKKQERQREYTWTLIIYYLQMIACLCELSFVSFFHIQSQNLRTIFKNIVQ